MIRTFRDQTTADIWRGENSRAARRIPKELWPIVLRKLNQLNFAVKLDEMAKPLGNNLHALSGGLAGFHAIRVNDQYRIIFRFEGHDAFEVSCGDYH